MSSDAIEPFDWSRRFFGLGRRGFFDDMFRGFDQMKREMEREFEDMEKRNMAKRPHKRIYHVRRRSRL
jgi:HSP20 family protein